MEVQLTRGFAAVIDDADWPLVKDYNWYPLRRKNTTYAIGRKRGWGNRTIGMHQLICPGADRVDHRDGNGLNNRRDNLRPATHRLNLVNNTRPVINATGFRGVVPVRYGSKVRYQARCGRIYGGTFDTAEEAARVRDDMARERHGEFARLNFPLPGEQPARRESAA